MFIDRPEVFVNPVLRFPSEERMTVLDDCMSFPGLCVKVMRYKYCTIEYYDMEFNKKSMELEGDLSELLQHEYDHLDGILATMRAIDNRSFHLKFLPKES
jgi:N-formylmethionyl-tRNA deformylase